MLLKEYWFANNGRVALDYNAELFTTTHSAPDFHNQCVPASPRVREGHAHRRRCSLSRCVDDLPVEDCVFGFAPSAHAEHPESTPNLYG